MNLLSNSTTAQNYPYHSLAHSLSQSFQLGQRTMLKIILAHFRQCSEKPNEMIVSYQMRLHRDPRQQLLSTFQTAFSSQQGGKLSGPNGPRMSPFSFSFFSEWEDIDGRHWPFFPFFARHFTFHWTRPLTSSSSSSAGNSCARLN